MASNKTLTDLIDYTNVLPYASELFGIYQPLLGWKSKRMISRFQNGFANDKNAILNNLRKHFAGQVDITYGNDCQVQVKMRPAALASGKIRKFKSLLMKALSNDLPPYEKYDTDVWSKVITRERVESILKEKVTPAYTTVYLNRCKRLGGSSERPSTELASQVDQIERPQFLVGEKAATPETRLRILRSALETRLQYEASMAGTILFLAGNHIHDELAKLFYAVKKSNKEAQELVRLMSALQAQDAFMSLDDLDPQDKEDLQNVSVSPISVVHLFREYFFELDTFLGSPVSHVWLSPGSTVELIEVHTLKTTEEKYYETSTESTTKAETDTTDQDELSDAVKEDNSQDIKFGASVTASYMGVTASNKFDYGTSQKTAREQTHKQMREQTEKLSTEIRDNYKSTFKTTTETTDMSSKRYVLGNSTSELINYELRRKMRQVAVQVQDVGTYLCWQVYVDRPGEHLGVAELMHIAQPAELDSLHAPDEIPQLQPFSEDKSVTVPFISIQDTDADNEGEVYQDGVEVDDSEVLGTLELIQSDFPMEAVCSKTGYVLRGVEADGQGQPVSASVADSTIKNADNKATFVLHLDSADFQGQDSVQVKLTFHWSVAAGANDEINKENKANTKAFKAKEAAAYQEAFIKTAQDRIKATLKVKPRSSDDLREEERIVVYRKLVQDLLTNGIQMPDDRTRHVVSELINSIFDIDKMLYFVAPDWWRPQNKTYSQQLGSADAPIDDDATTLEKALENLAHNQRAKITSKKLTAETVGWGGVNDPKCDNYWITEDSEPAKFGSSLGWLLQLDGDSLRNAFLNSPWVKAVVPIRPTKEEAAINWLKGVEGFNGIDDNDIYRTDNPNEKDINGLPLNGQKMIDVIMDLAKKIEQKYQEGLITGKYPTQDEISDPALVDEENIVTATPIDRVYEHGFFPLEGGFRANVSENYEIFDQWLEILPTDQIVPVEVKYDPRTGRQVDLINT